MNCVKSDMDKKSLKSKMIPGGWEMEEEKMLSPQIVG